jgi:hypothetical protein
MTNPVRQNLVVLQEISINRYGKPMVSHGKRSIREFPYNCQFTEG